MAQALVLEFDEIGSEEYRSVNAKLGIDMDSGEGDWPAGLRFHAGASRPGGGLLVFEIWDSQEDQANFMHGVLGAALGAAGVTGPPSKVEWLDLEAYQTLAG